MSFGRFMNRAKTGATKFFGSTLPSLKRNAIEGVRFFNTHIVPTARQIQSGIKQVNESVQADEKLSGKIKKKVGAIQKFSDVGLQNIEQAGGYANKMVAGLA